MLIKDVKKLTPTERWLYWCSERESIRLKRESGKEPPFTDDKIFQTFRFCNCRRMDDAVSRWLFDNWYDPYRDHPNMVAAVALARFINLPPSLERLTDLVFDKKRWDSKAMKRILRGIRDDDGNTVFNSAYMVRGNDGIDKIECVIDYYVQPLLDDPPEINTSSFEETWGEITRYHGYGSFQAGQVTADLRHALSGSWADADTFAPIGPGSIRGLNRLLNKWDRTHDNRWVSYSQKEFCDELTKLRAILAKGLPKIEKRLEAQDIQNTLCEYDKYIRTLTGESRPKRIFRSGE